MAERTWVGGAASVAQVWKTTVASAVSTDTYEIILTDEVGGTLTLTFTAGGGDTVTTIAAGLVALIAASADPRAEAVTAGNVAGLITLTADTNGTPFYPSTGGSGSFSGTGSTTVNSGPNDWNCVGNWAENAVPGSSDNVTLTGPIAIRFGLVQSTLAGFLIAPGCSAPIGGPGEYLQIVPTSFTSYGTGVSYINIGTAAIAPQIYNTGSSSAPQSGLYLIGSAMNGVMNIYGGAVELARVPGITSTAATIQVSGTGRVTCGAGLTLTNLDVVAGTAVLGCAVTTLKVDGGNVLTVGTGTITTATVSNGTVVFNSTGTITTLNKKGGTIDFTQSLVPRTVTNLTDYGTGTLLVDTSVITLTNGIIPSGYFKSVSTPQSANS